MAGVQALHGLILIPSGNGASSLLEPQTGYMKCPNSSSGQKPGSGSLYVYMVKSGRVSKNFSFTASCEEGDFWKRVLGQTPRLRIRLSAAI